MNHSIDIREEAGVRTLHFGSEWVQGAMRIARPWNLELDYTKDMMASLLLREGGGIAAGHPPAYSSRVLREGGGVTAGHPPAYSSRVQRNESRFPRKVLLIGLGAASLTKFLYRHYPLAKLTVVEIEPRVIAAARQFFKLPDDPLRLNIVVGDGAEYVVANEKSWDLILVDGFDADARPGGLDTLPFYIACRSRLGANGILAVNLFGRSRGFKASMERINNAFDERALAFPSCDSGNVIAFASTGNAVHIDMDELHDNALELKQNTGLNLLPTLARLQQAHTCKGGILIL